MVDSGIGNPVIIACPVKQARFTRHFIIGEAGTAVQHIITDYTFTWMQPIPNYIGVIWGQQLI